MYFTKFNIHQRERLNQDAVKMWELRFELILS